MSNTRSKIRLIKKAKEIRDREHRLSPNRRLKTRAQIIEFIHDKGLVSALGGNELPSLISAILGRPWRPSSKGFTSWLDWWSLRIEGQQLAHLLREIEKRDDILASRIFRRSKTLVSHKIWPILNPIVEYHKNLATRGKILAALELKLIRTIESEGTIRTDRLRKKLDMEGRENNYRFHRSLTNLENWGLIVGAEDPNPASHLHANVWQTWEKRTQSMKKNSEISYQTMIERLLEKTIDTCVVVHENKIREWFSWNTDTQEAKERLLSGSKLVRIGDFLVPPRVFHQL